MGTSYSSSSFPRDSRANSIQAHALETSTEEWSRPTVNMKFFWLQVVNIANRSFRQGVGGYSR